MGGKGAFWRGNLVRRETQLRWALFSGRRNTFPPKMRFFKYVHIFYGIRAQPTRLARSARLARLARPALLARSACRAWLRLVSRLRLARLARLAQPARLGHCPTRRIPTSLKGCVPTYLGELLDQCGHPEHGDSAVQRLYVAWSHSRAQDSVPKTRSYVVMACAIRSSAYNEGIAL